MSENAHSSWKGGSTKVSNLDGVGVPDFETQWPEIEAQLNRYLLKRGASREVVDEVVQDTAVRLLGCWERIDHGRPLGPLANKIAWNLLIDHHRRVPAFPVAAIPDQCSMYDIEEHRVVRSHLKAAAEGLRQLKERDRAVLLAEVGVGHITTNRMARLRARRRLQAIVDRVSSTFAGVPLILRRTFGGGQVGSTTDAINAVAAAGVLVVVSFVALTLDSGRDAHARVASPTELPLAQVEKALPSLRGADPVDLAETTGTISRSRSELGGPSVDEPPSTKKNDLRASAGPARAEKGHGRGYVYVQVCLGEDTQSEEDDYGVTVVLFDGGQSGEEDAPACSYGDEGDDDG